MLTTSQAAEILGVAPMTVRTLADQGALPSRRTTGGHRRFVQTDVLAFRGRPETLSASEETSRAAVWAAAVSGLLRNAEADLGTSCTAARTFRDARELIEDRLRQTARAAAPARPRRPRAGL